MEGSQSIYSITKPGIETYFIMGCKREVHMDLHHGTAVTM